MSIVSAVGHSDYVEEPFEAGQEIADMVLQKISLRSHSVGVLFCNIDFNFSELIRGIKSKLNIPIIGCTTATEGNNDGYLEDSASLIVISSDEVLVGMGLGRNVSENSEAAIEDAVRQAQAMLNGTPARLALTFPDITMKPVSADHMLAKLQGLLGPDVKIAGGLPADLYRFQKSFQFFNDEVISDSIPILLLAGDIDPIVVTRSGWIPIGEKATATKVNGNVVLEINGEPAVEYLKRYIPKILDDPQLFASYPLAILDESLGSDINKYFVIRSPFSYDKDTGSVAYAGEIPPNATVQLARGSRQDIISGTTDAASTLTQKVADKKLSSVIFFSCAGRKMMLGLDTKKEMDALLGSVPADLAVNGFYSYGEIGSLDSNEQKLQTPRFHNCTMVLCAF